MIRLLDLPNPGAYVKAWRRGREFTSNGGTVALFTLGEQLNAEQFTREMQRALDLRINARAGDKPTWRKLDELYQVELMRDAFDLRRYRTQRARPNFRRWRCPEIQVRFGYLLEDA